MNKYDSIANPSHYVEGRDYEPHLVIEDWGLNFNLGNVVKYIARAGRKDDALEDLLKARQYLDFEIAKRDATEQKETKVKEEKEWGFSKEELVKANYVGTLISCAYIGGITGERRLILTFQVEKESGLKTITIDIPENNVVLVTEKDRNPRIIHSDAKELSNSFTTSMSTRLFNSCCENYRYTDKDGEMKTGVLKELPLDDRKLKSIWIKNGEIYFDEACIDFGGAEDDEA